MIPARFAPVLSGFILSGVMSLVVSGIATVRLADAVPGLAGLWAGAWLSAWAIAFPIVLVAAPLARRAAACLVEPEAGARS